MIKANLMNKLIFILGLDIVFPKKFSREKFSLVSTSMKDFYARKDAFEIIKAFHNNDFRREGKSLIFNIEGEHVVLTDKEVAQFQFNKIVPTEVASEVNKKDKVAA